MSPAGHGRRGIGAGRSVEMEERMSDSDFQ